MDLSRSDTARHGANCREQNGEAMCGRETEWRIEVESRDGKDMTRKH